MIFCIFLCVMHKISRVFTTKCEQERAKAAEKARTDHTRFPCAGFYSIMTLVCAGIVITAPFILALPVPIDARSLDGIRPSNLEHADKSKVSSSVDVL